VEKPITACRALAAAALLVVAPTLSACDGDRGGQLTDGDRAAVAAEAEAVIDGLFAVTNAHDPDGVLAHFARGEELVQVACTEVRRGYDRLASVIRMWHEDRPDAALEHRVIRALALGPDAAVVAAQGSNDQGLALFWTFVLRRDAGGDLRIVQEHQSWPGCREVRVHRGG
jgi:ketosteroid isomerase-like protein